MVIQELIDKNLLVSIITPAYQSEKYIKHTIDAIIKQTYTNWELLITDDNSSDNTVNIINQYITIDKRIKLFKLNKNYGAAIARNNSIKNSNGRFIAFCDSDDLWMHDKLEEQLKFMLSNNYGFTYTAYNKIDINSNFIKYFSVPDKLSYHDLLKSCSIGCLTVMYDTKILSKKFFVNLRKRQDYVQWLTFLKTIPFAHGLNKPLANYRIHPNSISSNKLSASRYQWYVYRHIEKLSFIDSCYYFIFYFFNGLNNYYFK
jgi:teichuronic acid biosynthesis glycosyltransferase TuaG